MKIIKTPNAEVSMIEFGYDTRSTFRIIADDVTDRIDRILGGNPKPHEPEYTIRLPGRTTFTRGLMVAEAGETVVIGEKLSEPLVTPNGVELHGVIPLHENADGTIEFCIDYLTTCTQR